MNHPETNQPTLEAKLTMTAEELFELHPLPWTHHLLLIKDANGQQVIHTGGAYNDRGRPHKGEYLSGLNALMVQLVNTCVPVASAAPVVDTDNVFNMVWAEEAGVAIYIYQAERTDRRVIEIRKGDQVLATVTVAKHNRDNLAESIATGELRYSSEKVSRLVQVATTPPAAPVSSFAQFQEGYHPSRQGGLSESQEAEIAAIISKHFAAAPADNQAELDEKKLSGYPTTGDYQPPARG